MKSIRPRLVLALGAVALVGALVPAGSAQADPDVANCEIVGFVVKDPTHVVQASSGSGLFGSVEIAGTPVQSRVVCEGSITGAALIEGTFVWCPNTHAQTGHGNPVTCNGASSYETHDEALWPGALPTSVHVVGSATTSADLVLAHGPETNVSCSFEFHGHAFVPLPRLDVKNMVCGSHESEFVGTAEAGFVPVIGPTAGDLFEASPDPETCASWGAGLPPGESDQDCFRAVVFAGDMTVGAPDPFH